MKRVKIIMDSGEIYYFQSCLESITIERAAELFFINGKPKEVFILMDGGDMTDRLVIVPKHISSLQEETY